MSKGGAVDLGEGWYVPTKRVTPPRWVLALGNGYVYYSRGGTTHFECSEKTMRRWITRTAAQRKRRQHDDSSCSREVSK